MRQSYPGARIRVAPRAGVRTVAAEVARLRFTPVLLPIFDMKVMHSIWWLRTLAVLLTIALATSGFAHRFATPEQQAALDYAQTYGLDISSICGDFEDADSTQTCEACRLHTATSLPEPAVALILAELSCDPADWVPQPPVLNALTAEAARPARAPPTV